MSFISYLILGYTYIHAIDFDRVCSWLPMPYQEARCIQEILGIEISLIYHFSDQQQVSDLSHIGLLSCGITFQKV